MRMAAHLGWLVACYGNFTHGSEEKNQDPRRSGRSTCTDALHDAATNIIATRKDRNDTFMADPASYTREIETRRETTSLVIINSDAPMVAEARSIMLSGSSTPKNAQARLVAGAQAAGTNNKAEPSNWCYRGLQKMGKPGQQPTPMAKDNQPRQAGWQGDPAGQETKATRKWQRTEPPNSIQINLIAGCGIHEAPCFWKSPNFYKQVLLVLCVIVKCYVHYGATYGIYNMLNQMVQREPVLACDLDDRQHMSLVNGSIEKCCGVNTGHYSIPARDKD